MTTKDLENHLVLSFPGAQVHVTDLTGQSNHFEVRMRAEQFNGLRRLEQQRAIMESLGPQLKSGEIHALSLKTLAMED